MYKLPEEAGERSWKSHVAAPLGDLGAIADILERRLSIHGGQQLYELW
jgi:hypothetical protein